MEKECWKAGRQEGRERIQYICRITYLELNWIQVTTISKKQNLLKSLFMKTADHKGHTQNILKPKARINLLNLVMTFCLIEWDRLLLKIRFNGYVFKNDISKFMVGFFCLLYFLQNISLIFKISLIFLVNISLIFQAKYCHPTHYRYAYLHLNKEKTDVFLWWPFKFSLAWDFSSLQ